MKSPYQQFFSRRHPAGNLAYQPLWIRAIGLFLQAIFLQCEGTYIHNWKTKRQLNLLWEELTTSTIPLGKSFSLGSRRELPARHPPSLALPGFKAALLDLHSSPASKWGASVFNKHLIQSHWFAFIFLLTSSYLGSGPYLVRQLLMYPGTWDNWNQCASILE